MSDIAKLNLTLAGVVVMLAAAVFVGWPQEALPTSSALASPYCASNTMEVELAAQAAFVKDLATGKILHERHAESQLPLASLTKLMTVYAASVSLSYDDAISVPVEALYPEGGKIREGEVWRVGDLIDYTLITSDNDAAHALALASAERARENHEWFIREMNGQARDLGMSQTYFTNDTGLDASETVGGNYGSAHDVAILLEAIYKGKPRLIEASALQKRNFLTISGESYDAENTTPISTEISGAIASKTGFTDLAGRNLAVIFEPILGHPSVAVILGSTDESRDADMRALSEATKKKIRKAILCGQI
jgi:serine-type D-Ala-D-Ala carboxypeptidase (penicillin-binding protein 5/6)